MGFSTFDWATSQAEAVAISEGRFPDLTTAEKILEMGTGAGAVREICETKRVPTVFIVTNRHALCTVVPGAVLLEKPFSTDDLKAAVEIAQQIVEEKNLMFWQVNNRRLTSY